MPSQLDLLQGTLDVLVLKALSWGPQHGHAIARMIRTATSGAIEVFDGSLYAALHRLEEREWVAASWELSSTARSLLVVSSEGNLEELETFIAYRQRYEEGRQFLSGSRQPS